MEEWIIPVASIIVAIIASLPGLLALFKQRKKEEAEIKKTDAEIANMVQEIYQDMVEDVRKKSDSCKEEINKLSGDLAVVINQNKELKIAYDNLAKINENLVVKLEKLTAGIKLLIAQIKREGLTPDFEVEEDDAT